MPLTAVFHLLQRPGKPFIGPMTFNKGLDTMSNLIAARNTLPMCEEWVVCDRAIHALVHGFVVSDVVTDNKHSEGEGGDNGDEMKKEAVGEYLAAITATCDRVSRLEPSSSTGHGEMDSVHVHPRMAFMALIKKIVAASAAGVGEGEDWEEIGDDGGMEREYEYDSSVKNLLAVCAAGAK